MAGGRIVSAGPLPDWVVADLSKGFDLVVLDAPTEAELLGRIDDSVVALISRSTLYIGSATIDAAPNLKLIARSGVGFDNVDLEAATARGLPVIYTPGALSQAVAEHTLALILWAAKDLCRWRQRIAEGRWSDRDRHLNLHLEGKIVGIVGLGRIGRQVRRLLAPFGVRFLVSDPYLDPARYEDESLRFTTLSALLGNSEVVTLHVPLTEETQGLIGSHNLEEFKPGAILVNTARGAVIESHEVLLAALVRGRLGAVVLDTPVEEPLDPSDPLLHHPRVLITPHVASRTTQAQERVLRTVVSELKAVLGGGLPNPENVVNPQVLGFSPSTGGG